MNEHVLSLSQKYPAIRELVEKEGRTTLRDYLKKIGNFSLPSIMPSGNLLEEVSSYFLPFFGKERADEASRIIANNRCLSTSNHHHFSFEFMTVQETILYDAWLRIKQSKSTVVPFFAASNLNLTNTVYPRGMLIYDCLLPQLCFRLPLYHWKLKRQCIASLYGVNQQMINRAKERIEKEVLLKTISKGMGDTLLSICDEIFLSDDVLKYDKLKDQTTVVNALLSQKYFLDREPMYLWMPLETIASRLFLRDIQYKNGILYNILFNKDLRDLLIKNLNGVSGCWTDFSGGTHFFWALDSSEILFALHLEERNSELVLRGENSLKEEVVIPFKRETLEEKIDEGILLPGLFLCFFEIYFLRDFSVFGGYYQPTYLKKMSDGIVKSLRELGIFGKEASIIEKKSNYLSLGLTYLLRGNSERIYPVSTAELLEQPIRTQLVDEKLNITTVEDSLMTFALET